MTLLTLAAYSRCILSLYTLAPELLEAYGGKDALEGIKRMVPTYESCLYSAELGSD
jgi:hypothetical protein